MNRKSGKMKVRISILAGMMIFLISFIPKQSQGQQDPMYTQYMFNTQVVNPAYAGTWKTMGFMFLTRHQWVGFDGHPATNTFTVQTPLKNENVGLGLSVMHDEIGYERRIGIYGDYSYKLTLKEGLFLRLGLKGGFMQYHNNLNNYTLYTGGPSDPQFQGVVEDFMPNFGVGAFMHSDRFYLGLSIPKLMENSFDNSEISESIKAEKRHLFFIGGVVLDLSEDVKFKPTVYSKLAWNAPVQFDFTANFLIKETFWLGGMYRTGDSFGFIAQWIFNKNKNMRIGYAIDFTKTELRNNHNGVHEIMVSYELDFKKLLFSSPRYF
ncbi:type IX secretion system membrane protein PorP/SprF [Puteibacter caeruleilacunae]|nr:type IX secretion system membrane protein PorP/SprF [Puteibacter caeruleilacunae]